jgi:hypothetical protein
MTCNKCGAWYDAPKGEGGWPLEYADPEVYLGEVFGKLHRKCGGGVSYHPYEAGAPPARPPGQPWDPASSPDFLPHSKAYLRHDSNSGQSLLGAWFHSEIYPDRKTVVLQFLDAGCGRCLDTTLVDPEFDFHWRLHPNGNLVLEAPECFLAAAELRQFFGPEGHPFQQVTYTEPFGRASTHLLLWPGPDQEALALYGVETSYPTSDQPDWEIEESQNGIEVSRLTRSYLERLFRQALNLRITVMDQMDAADRQDWRTRAGDGDVDWRDNFWVFPAGLVPGLFSHLQLAEGTRLPCLFDQFGPCGDVLSGNSRLILIDSRQAGSLDAPPPALRKAALDQPAPPHLPGWVSWCPAEAVGDDGSPPAVFERFLLDDWLTELLTPGPGFCYEGIVTDNDCGLFLDATLPLPPALAFTGNVRPGIAFVAGANVPAAFLPTQPEGRDRVGAGPFAYLEFHTCWRRVGGLTLPRPGPKLGGTAKIRVWFRGGKRLWSETERQVLAGDPLSDW